MRGMPVTLFVRYIIAVEFTYVHATEYFMCDCSCGVLLPLFKRPYTYVGPCCIDTVNAIRCVTYNYVGKLDLEVLLFTSVLFLLSHEMLWKT